MGYSINGREVSEEEYNRWLCNGAHIVSHAPAPMTPLRGNSLLLGGLMGMAGLGYAQANMAAQMQAQQQSFNALANYQMQAFQAQEAAMPSRTQRVVAAFDWDQASNLHYIDSFFAKWGFEPFELPKVEESCPKSQ